jgi:hypothetical protein
MWDINKIDMNKLFNSAHLINLIARWRYHLLAIVVVSVIFAAVLSSSTFITPLYKSNAVAYPANITSYSGESTTEQMLQILGSQDIVDSVIKKFNLAKHYEINPENKYYKTALYNTYHEHISIKKTKYESVQIEVSDRNPDTASLMVSSILDYYDSKISYLHKSKSLEVIDMYTIQLNTKRILMDSLKNVLYKLGTEQGLFDYGNQSREIMRGYLRTVDGSNNSEINNKEVNRLLKNMEKGSGELIETVQMLQAEAGSYVSIKYHYELEMRFYNSDLTYSNIISYPYSSDKKSYPIRWLIIAIVSLGSFVMSLLIIFFLENNKKQS